MPMKTVASLIILVAMGVFAYTELTSRLVSLETSRELFENDLLKKSEQVPVDQEQHFLLEDLYKSVEKMEETQEMNMTNKVNIEFLRDQLEKALKDIEDLKDDYKKENPEINLLGDKFIKSKKKKLIIPKYLTEDENVILPLPKPKDD